MELPGNITKCLFAVWKSGRQLYCCCVSLHFFKSNRDFVRLGKVTYTHTQFASPFAASVQVKKPTKSWLMKVFFTVKGEDDHFYYDTNR